MKTKDFLDKSKVLADDFTAIFKDFIKNHQEYINDGRTHASITIDVVDTRIFVQVIAGDYRNIATSFTKHNGGMVSIHKFRRGKAILNAENVKKLAGRKAR